MSPDTEALIMAMVERSRTRQGSRWADITTVGVLLSDLPPRSRDRKEIASLLSSQARCGARTQANYTRLWRILTEHADPSTGEVPIPTAIDYSTALELVKRGADYATIRRADEESWTLKDARLWAQDKARVVDEKPLTLWRVLTREIPAHYRKRVEALSPAEVSEFVGLVRDAVRLHGGGSA
jgi:hypothetical protein